MHTGVTRWSLAYCWNRVMHVSLQADYTLFVRVHNFKSPSHKCPVCRSRSSRLLGCCDNFSETSECTGSDRCDNSFQYCLRRLGSLPNTNPYHTASCRPVTVTTSNTDGAELDFNSSILLGRSNPLQFRRSGGWRVCQSSCWLSFYSSGGVEGGELLLVVQEEWSCCWLSL